MKTTFRLIVGLFVVAGPTALLGQGFTRIEEMRTNTAFYYYAIPGEATVEVSVLGSVQRPGIYVVGAETRLDGLLALTGGPTEREAANTRTDVDLRLLRSDSGIRRPIYEASLQAMLDQPGAYPLLLQGDVLIVQTRVRRTLGWRDAVQILTGLSSLAVLVLRILDV